MKEGYSGPPATIADLRRIGLSAIEVICSAPNCWHTARVPFEQLGVQEDVYMIDLPKLRRFTCQHCGSTQVRIMPDWSDYAAAGRP